MRDQEKKVSMNVQLGKMISKNPLRNKLGLN